MYIRCYKAASLFLAMPGATSRVLAPSSKARSLVPSSFLLLLVRHLLLEAMHLLLVASCS